MRAKEFIIEYNVFDKGSFVQKSILNGKYVVKARAKEKSDGSTVFIVTVYDPKKPKVSSPLLVDFGFDGIASFRFIKRKDGSVASADTYVDSEYQRQGIATEVYKFAKSLGLDVQPSRLQTDQGREMWKSFKNKGIL